MRSNLFAGQSGETSKILDEGGGGGSWVDNFYQFPDAVNYRLRFKFTSPHGVPGFWCANPTTFTIAVVTLALKV